MSKNKHFTRYHNRMPSEDSVLAAVALAKAILQETQQFGTLRKLVPYAERILADQLVAMPRR